VIAAMVVVLVVVGAATILSLCRLPVTWRAALVKLMPWWP
jgi:hypothetical protein